MKYLCTIYHDEKKMDAMPKEEFDAVVGAAASFVERLRAEKRLVAVERLDSPRKAASIRVRKGKLSITDGPFAETKEQLAGFILIDAKDLNEATQVMSQFPAAPYGTVEVRPILPLNTLRHE